MVPIIQRSKQEMTMTDLAIDGSTENQTNGII